MTSIGDPSKLGVVGSSAVLYYLVTMLIAVIMGTILVTTFRPGDLPVEVQTQLRGEAEAQFEQAQSISSNIQKAEDAGQSELGGAWLNILRQLIPLNIIDEMSQGRTLAPSCSG